MGLYGGTGLSSSGTTPFPSATAWSVVLGAADRGSADWRAHFETLVRKYWKPVWRYLVRRWGLNPDDAADFTQEFFARLLEEDTLRKASPAKGRFRLFLKFELRDLVVEKLRRRTAQKRGGGRAPLPLSEADRDLRRSPEASSPEDEFDRTWAAEIVSRALERLEERLRAGGRDTTWAVFRLCAVGAPPKTYRDCARELGLTVTDVGNHLFRARREFRRLLLDEVRESLLPGENAEEELEYLLRLLGQMSS